MAFNEVWVNSIKIKLKARSFIIFLIIIAFLNTSFSNPSNYGIEVVDGNWEIEIGRAHV